jgi:mono/diheme cytochrome c family protein
MNACKRPPLRIVVCLAVGMTVALAGVIKTQVVSAGRYDQTTGEALYIGICQGCHMPNAQGAHGAGSYPALARNPRLAASLYAVSVVVNGQKAMPRFGPDLNDEQIAAVINHVRTHFGNHYMDPVKPAMVAALRR